MLRTESLHITPEILSLIAEVDEFKGAWRALGQLAPEQLSSLRRVATIESIGSSTRIEGSRLSDAQVEALLGNLQIGQFATRDEQEVAGYAEVMNIVFQNYEDIPLSESHVQQLHRELLRYSGRTTGTAAIIRSPPTMSKRSMQTAGAWASSLPRPAPLKRRCVCASWWNGRGIR